MNVLPRFLVLSALLVGSHARAADPRVVMVLYFDNNTGNPDYDVLQKGLADMLITDLSAVESIQVVEREKLQAALDELKLQRTQYFDPKTAQRIGRGIGAQYAVTGSIAAIEPKVHINIRMFEVETAKVLVGDSVSGPKENFFELEAQLVEKFVSKLSARDAKSGARSGQTSVANLLDYSHALDAADKGDLKGASSKMAAVVRNAPEFSLAKRKYAEFLKRLRLAGKKRERLLSEAEEKLLAKLEGYLKPTVSGLAREELRMHLGARVTRSAFYAMKLKTLLMDSGAFGAHYPRREATAQFERWFAELIANDEKFIAEAEAIYAAAKPGSSPSLVGYLPAPDADLCREIGLERGAYSEGPRTLADAYDTLAALLIHGRQWRHKLPPTRPAPIQRDPRLALRAIELLEKARAQVEKRDPKSQIYELTQLIDMTAEAYVLLGRKEEAVAHWQGYLDTYPTGSKFQEFEKKIEELLGVTESAELFEKQIATCDQNLTGRMYEEVRRMARADKTQGLRVLEARITESCKDSMMRMAVLPSFYIYASMAAAEQGDCAYPKEAREKVPRDYPAILEGFDRSVNFCP